MLSGVWYNGHCKSEIFSTRDASSGPGNVTNPARISLLLLFYFFVLPEGNSEALLVSALHCETVTLSGLQLRYVRGHAASYPVCGECFYVCYRQHTGAATGRLASCNPVSQMHCMGSTGKGIM